MISEPERSASSAAAPRWTERPSSKIALALSVTLIVLLACEVTVRLRYPDILWHAVDDDLLGWSTREYKRFRAYPPDGRVRLLFLGDSFLAGSGIDDLSERFPVVLAERIGASADVRILAAGGWGTDQELLAYLAKGRAWKPRVVVLAFCSINDISNNVSNAHEAVGRKPYFTVDRAGTLQRFDGNDRMVALDDIAGATRAEWVEAIPESALLGLGRRIFSGPAVREPIPVSTVDERYGTFPGAERPQEIYSLKAKLTWSPQMRPSDMSAYIADDLEMNTYQWRVTRAIIAQLTDAVRADGGTLVAMLLPTTLKSADPRFIAGGSLVQRFDTPDGPFTMRAAEPRDRLAAITKELNVRFFDPTAAFIKTVVEEHRAAEFWPSEADRHFAAPAHALLAEQTYRYLSTNGLLPHHVAPDAR